MSATRAYPTPQIRNVAVLGHGGSGKTSLIDALCYVAGSSERHGSVPDGTALTMYAEEEVAHGISLQATPAFAEWRDAKLNLLDTPGYLDFIGEAVAATRVADGAVVVLGATTGVEVGTEKVWEYCEARNLPRLFFVSMMDREHADFEEAYRQITETLTDKVIPVEIPIGAGAEFRGIINLFSGRAHSYEVSADARGEYEETEIPDELRDRFETWRTELIETIATTDDTLLERYLEGGEIDRERALTAMKAAMARCEMFPLFCGAPEKTWGTRALLSKLVELMPSPAEARPETGRDPDTGETLELRAADDAELAALVFKTMSEPHVGELSYFRVYSGRVEDGREVTNAGRGGSEKLAHLAVAQGEQRLDVPRLHAGDIGVVAKLRDTHTNDTLASADRPLLLEPVAFPRPDIAVAVRAESRSDEEKIGAGLQKLHEEDPTFHSSYEPELKQTIIRGLGELHLDVQIERLKRKFGVAVATEAPRIPYRETIQRVAEARGKYKKQTGGRGQYGDCRLRLRPLSRGEGYRFVDAIVGGVIPGKFIPSVDKGVREAARKGIVAGYPLVDFEAECYDGSHHSVDSSDVAFQVAGSMAFKEAAAAAAPVLLEPVHDIEVVTPEEYMGDIIGDLNQRRGRILGMESESGRTRIRARVPQAELYKYATKLRSITHGRAMHVRAFHGYEDVPQHVAQQVIEEARREEVPA